MADRYQDRPFPADDDHDRGDDHARAGESDPLAELARLIGQTDPFGAAPGRPHPLQSRANVRPQAYQPPQDYQHPSHQEDEAPPAGPPPWMQRARQEAPPQQDYEEPREEEYQPSPVHPLHRYAAQHTAAPRRHRSHEAEYRDDLPYRRGRAMQPDPSRYDDALYGRIESGEQDYQRDPAYPDDPYAYQGGYEEERTAPKKRSSGLMTVVAVLALAVVGTGAAFAYRTYVGSPRSGGEPPIIKADNSPTKVVPAPSDAVSKTPDRMATGGDGTEKLVSARRDAGRRQRQVRPARGFSAAEPERQPAAGGERSAIGAAARRWPPTARCRTTSRARSRRSPSRAIPPAAGLAGNSATSAG